MPAGNRGPRSYRALLAILAAMGCAALLGAGSPAAHAGGATTTLSNDVVHNLGLATQTGAVPASQVVTAGIYLANPNQAAEDAYVKQLYDPSSSNYGNFLDSDTFNSQFAVPRGNRHDARRQSRTRYLVSRTRPGSSKPGGSGRGFRLRRARHPGRC